MKTNRRSFVKGLLGALVLPKALKAESTPAKKRLTIGMSEREFGYEKYPLDLKGQCNPIYDVDGKELSRDEIEFNNEDYGCVVVDTAVPDDKLFRTTGCAMSTPYYIKGLNAKQKRQHRRIVKHFERTADLDMIESLKGLKT